MYLILLQQCCIRWVSFQDVTLCLWASGRDVHNVLEALAQQHSVTLLKMCALSALFLLLWILWITYTGCHRRNGPNFGRVFLMLNYTDITQNTYVPKLNGYGDNGQRKVWTSCIST